ncbi:MAG: ATP-binding protein [Anaerolineae bacterium]
MSTPDYAMDSEFRLPLNVVVALLAAVGILLIGAAQEQAQLLLWSHLLDLGLFVIVGAGLCFVLGRFAYAAGAWLAILLTAGALFMASEWLQTPAALTLLVIPAILAVTLMGMAAGLVTGVLATATLLALSGGSGAEVVVALIAMWVVLAALYGIYRPTRQLRAWLDEYLQRAQRLVVETRDRKASYESTLADLEHANRQLALLNERNTDLRLIAEEAQRAKARFVARVSHEFRTPLNMIIGLVDLMVERPEIYDIVLPPKLQDDLKVVHRNCELLGKMVNDVLDLSQAETDHLSLHRERADLGGIITSAAVAVQPLLEGKHLALHIEVPDDLPGVYCDGTRIEQVVLNLLSNAARYTERGEVTVRAARVDEQIEVSVTDTGPGILPEDAGRIFEPFFQGAEGQWSRKHGSGLGLNISKKIIELHGGRIGFETEVGVGTTFSFNLPISPPLVPTRRPEGRISDGWEWYNRETWPHFGEAHYRPRLVVLDPPGELYAALARHTEEVEFVHAADLDQVVAALASSPAHAVLVNAGTHAGLWPLVGAVKGRANGTPILACSMRPTPARAKALGSAGYLVKPVTRAHLEQALKSARQPVKRVLIVDDEPATAQLFARMLHTCAEGLEVTCVGGGAEALTELQRGLPDLMLLDLAMPDMNGWQVLEAMAGSGTLQAVPTMIVSASDATDQPPTTDYILLSASQGLSLSKLLMGSLALSAMLLRPEGEPDPALR